MHKKLVLHKALCVVAVFWGALSSVNCTARQAETSVSLEKAAKMEVSSSAFPNGQTIPKEFTADGNDSSPPLAWTGLPKDAKSIALIVDDPDAPMGTWVHWVLYDLPGDATSLDGGVKNEEKLANGAVSGLNSWKKNGWGGPSPPPGKPHRYFFKVYALDKKLELKAKATKGEVLKAMDGHVVGHGELMGMYGR